LIGYAGRHERDGVSIPIDELSDVTRTAATRLHDEVVAIVGADVVAAWVDGGSTFADRPRNRTSDVDMVVVVDRVDVAERQSEVWRADLESRPARLVAAQGVLADQLGVDYDVEYLLESEMAGGALPSDAFSERRVRTMWPVVRAHWLAGQYVHLSGKRPEDLVVAPSRAELERALDREIEHLERHVHEGDAADPYEATYAVGNGCRVLFTLATGSPVISKRSAGDWGLAHLPEEWHPAIRAAGRAYDEEASPADRELLRDNMAPFVAMVRAHLPVTEPRPPGPPRWSS
jgi:hypothetical protein